jgi:hypothetical protein
VRPAQLLARVDARLLTPQPLAAEQVRTGDVNDDPAAPEMVDRLAVQRVGLVAVAQQRARAGLHAERPARTGDARALSELRQRPGCLVKGAAPHARLDELGQRPAEEPQILVLARAPGRGERDRVLAEPVVRHRQRVLGQADRPSSSAGGRIGDGRPDQLLGLDPVAAPGRQQQGRVPERRAAGGRADRIGVLDQRVGRRELPGVHVHAGPRRERDRKDRERTGLAGRRHRPAGEPVPRLVVPEVGPGRPTPPSGGGRRPEGLRRGSILPLRVVDDADEGAFLSIYPRCDEDVRWRRVGRPPLPGLTVQQAAAPRDTLVLLPSLLLRLRLSLGGRLGYDAAHAIGVVLLLGAIAAGVTAATPALLDRAP